MENFYTTVQTSSGQVINGAIITVYDAGSGLPATIYEPDGVTLLSNPFLSGYARSEGEIEFGAANGQYNIKIVNGVEIDWIYRITLLDSSGFAFGALAYENDASGVPITDVGNYYASADVEGALQEAGADLAAHIADATDVHDASAISIVDAGGFYSSADVEGALQEVSSLPPNYAYFSEARNTAFPNGTVPAHQWIASGGETNIDVVLSPKGLGAILAHIPDGAAAGGNKRGEYAVDLQRYRGISTEVASGIRSVICGGGRNTASATYSTVGGGLENSASALYSTVSGGEGNISDGLYSCIPGGASASARGLTGRYSYASSSFYAASGASQIGLQVLSHQTSDAAATILTADAAIASSVNVSVLPDYHSYSIIATITARDSSGDTASWIIKGAAKRGAGAATTALVGTPSIETIIQDAGASTWAASLVANTTRGSAEIQVTGQAGTLIHWVCKFETVEVG